MSIPCKCITNHLVRKRYGGYQIRHVHYDVFGRDASRTWDDEWWPTKQQAVDAKARMENP